jgi:hypothetical protein
MSLPVEWIDKIFLKLTLNYGVEFMARYKGLNPNDVKSDWCHELSFAEQRPDAIKFALENLPDRPPTAQAFKALCLSAPAKESALAIEHQPPANPQAVAEVMSRLNVPVPRLDDRAWARKHLAEHKAGIPKTPTVLQMARNAVGAT